MRSEPATDDDIGTRMMKARMAKFLHPEGGQIDLRTFTVLQKNGVFKADIDAVGVGSDAAALLDGTHPGGVPAKHGPLVFNRPGGSDLNEVVDVSSFLFSDNGQVRRMACEHYDPGQGKEPWVSRKTLAVIRSNGEALQSAQSRVWQAAAVKILDAISDDWLINLSGVRQSIQMEFEAGYSEFMERVLRPSRGVLETIRRPIWNPTEDRSKLEEALSRMVVEATTLVEAMDRYMEVCGCVPLAGPLAMSRVVGEWMSKRMVPDDVWTELWGWAEKRKTPIARYHVCETLFMNPRYVPDGQHGKFWAEVANVMDVGGRDEAEGGRWSAAWRLRCSLARHYCDRIECMCPGAAGDRVAMASWWMADSVASLIAQEDGLIRRFQQTTVTPHYRASAEMWNLVGPPIQSSLLRYLTLFVPLPWAVGLQSRLGRSLRSLRPDQMATVDREKIERSLRATVLFVLLRRVPGQVATYAFEEDVVGSAEAWANTCPGDADETLRQLVEVNRNICAEEGVAALLEALGKGNEGSNLLIARAMQTWAYQGQLSAEDVWKRLSDAEWRHEVFSSCSDDAIVLLFDAMRQLMITQFGDWASHLPHFLAMAAEAATSEERRNLLFDLTVYAAIAAGTSSAIRRLLTGARKHEFSDAATRLRARIDAIYPRAVPWAASRLRAARLALRV